MTEGKTFKLRYKEINPDNARINNMKIYKGKYILVLQRLIIHLLPRDLPYPAGNFYQFLFSVYSWCGGPLKEGSFQISWDQNLSKTAATEKGWMSHDVSHKKEHLILALSLISVTST